MFVLSLAYQPLTFNLPIPSPLRIFVFNVVLFESVGGPPRPLKHTGGMTRRSLYIRRLSTFFPARSPTLNGRLTKRGGGGDAKTILSAGKRAAVKDQEELHVHAPSARSLPLRHAQHLGALLY